jgi:3-methyladenine DNA glycosylase AlkD
VSRTPSPPSSGWPSPCSRSARFTRKAIGWVLRERARRCPDEVFAWLLVHAPRASGLTLREASKPLTAEQRERVVIAQHRAG